jgi:CheY-like chemotaxis protein
MVKENAMPMNIVILEDNEERRAAMAECLRERFPQYRVSFFATAPDAIEFLSTRLDQTILISLDHDLDMIAGSDGRVIDPGTGRDVANFLATQRAVCPVVIHTTNAPAAIGMQQCLCDAGWEPHCLAPYGHLTWIDEAWFPLIRRAIVDMALTEPGAG